VRTVAKDQEANEKIKKREVMKKKIQREGKERKLVARTEK